MPFDLAGDLVMGYESQLTVEDGNLVDDGIPYYGHNDIGHGIRLYDEQFTILMRLVNLSGAFYYETVPQEK